MSRGVGLLAVVLALAGCKSTADPKPTGRDPLGLAAGRAKSKDDKEPKAPAWLDPVAKLPGRDTAVPTAGSWSGDPKSRNFDAKLEAQDALGGRVLDMFNRPARNIFIRIEGVDDPPGTAAKGIYTDNNGYFFTRGLKPNATYNLTAEATLDGKRLTGSVQTRVPNPVLTIVLREDLGLPPVGLPRPTTPGGVSGDSGPAAGRARPPVPEPTRPAPAGGSIPSGSRMPRAGRDGAYSPEAGPTRPLPAPIGGGAVPGTAPSASPTPPPANVTPGGGLPPPDDLALPTGKPIRPENVADGPRPPWQPPPTSIPGPPVPVYPVPPPSPVTQPNTTLPGAPPLPSPSPASPSPASSPDQPRSRSSPPRPATSFTLIDSQERPWHFPADRAGSLVLLEFVTTNCVHCKPVIPLLRDLQARYAAHGLQVVAVLCDELPLSARAAAAARYGRDNDLNYAVFVEPGSSPGSVRDRLGVEAYPTAILLDENGAILWRGHPGRKRELEMAIQHALGR